MRAPVPVDVLDGLIEARDHAHREDQVEDVATFLNPTELARGMRYVFVNGRLAIDDGATTGRLAGRVLTHAPRPVS